MKRLLLVLGLTACGTNGGQSKSPVRQAGWTQETIASNVNDCIANVSPKVEVNKRESFCSCFIDKVSYAFPETDTADQGGAVSQGFAKQCADANGLTIDPNAGTVSLDMMESE